MWEEKKANHLSFNALRDFLKIEICLWRSWWFRIFINSMFKIFLFFTSSRAPLTSSLASSLQKFSLNTTGQQCSTVSHRQRWFTPSASLKETGTRQLMTTVSVLQGACSNVITVIQKFQDSLFVCGTNGNRPRCWKLVSVCTCLGWCLAHQRVQFSWK